MSIVVGSNHDDAVIVESLLLQTIEKLLNLHVGIVTVHQIVQILRRILLVSYFETMLHTLRIGIMHRHGDHKREEGLLSCCFHL